MTNERILFVLGIFLFINNINGLNHTESVEKPLQDVDVVKVLREAVDIFSYKILMKSIDDDPKSNLIMSPFSIWSLMTVLAEGAKNKTLYELESTLQLPILKNVRLGYKNIRKALVTNTTSIEFDTINSIFYDDQQSIKEDFIKNVKDIYDADVYKESFLKPLTLDKINNKINESTRGRITEIVNPDDMSGAKAIITNTVYFKGQWKLPFNNSLTKKQPFYDSHNKVTGDVNMMHAKANFPFVNVREHRCFIVKLPYGQDSKFSMYVILPHYNITLNDVAANFVNSSFNNLYKILDRPNDYFDDEELDLSLPRFNINRDMKLNDILKSMGINDIFNPVSADLSAMTSDNDLFLSRVGHKARIEVTEEGTVATAVTEAVLANRNPTPKIVINKPFMYFIVEKSTQLMIVAGTYVNPELY